jgi:vacuolar-type H+-ATPase subunit C/Vma6
MASFVLKELIGLRYDFYNASMLLWAKLSESEDEPFLYESEGNTDIPSLKKAVEGSSSLGVPEYILNAVSGAAAAFERTKKTSDIEIHMDREYFRTLIDLSRGTGNPFFIRGAETACDLFNIKAFFRAAKMKLPPEITERVFAGPGKINKNVFLSAVKNPEALLNPGRAASEYSRLIEYGSACLKEGSPLPRLEAISREIELDGLSRAGGVIMGPEPVLAYYIKTMHEIETISIIYAGIKTSAPVDSIKERTVLPSS